MGNEILIRELSHADWDQVKEIYIEGIKTGNATFEMIAPEWEEWDQKHVASCRIVAVLDDEIAGWAALSKISERCVYEGVGEVSIYISEKYRGKGIGKKLLEELIRESEMNGFWTLQAGIFPENTASIKLHEKLGFRIIGRRERIGKMKGMWRDTLLLERRSEKTGVE